MGEAGEARAAGGLLERPSQRTTVGTPDCRQGNKLIPSHKLAATWDCWLSKALRRLLEETPGFPVSPKQSQCLCKAHVSLGLGFCLLYRVELPWFCWGEGLSIASPLLFLLCAHSLKCAVTDAVAGSLHPGRCFPLRPPGLTLIAARQFLEKRFQEKSRVP